jgi:hypothetical protein
VATLGKYYSLLFSSVCFNCIHAARVDINYGVKVAVSVMGPPIVIEAGLSGPEYEPMPLPVQLLKLKPRAGLALMETVAPLFFHPLAGLTLPPVPAIIVRKYCVLNVAV